jgi:hypothetical protein
MTKIAGTGSESGSISQRHGSTDLDPDALQMSWNRNTAPFPCHTIPGSFRYRATRLVGAAAETGVTVQGGLLGDDLPAGLALGQQPEVGAQGPQIRDRRITRSEKRNQGKTLEKVKVLVS